MTVRVEPDPGFSAGHARITVPGGAAAVSSPGLRIQREEDWGDDKLGPLGWQTSEALLTPDRAEASGPDLVLHLGWAVCQHLEAGMYSLWVPGAGVAAAAMSWPEIVPLHAGALSVVGLPPDPAAASPPALPTPPPAATMPPAPPRPQPVQTAPQPRRMLGPVLGLLFLAVLVAGGGAYWWLYGRPHDAGTASVQPPPAPPATPVPPPAIVPPGAETPAPPPGLGGLSVPDVVAQAPNAAAIGEEGARRLRADRRDDGLLLLETAADRGDPAAAAALARLYDPVPFQPGGPIPRPDPRQAARYYRDAARAGSDVAAAREALRKELERRSQAGDLGAGLSLKDFWP